MTELIDDREAKLPRWAQNELARLRLHVERANDRVEAARAEFSPANSDTIVEPYEAIPKGLGVGPTVRYSMPGNRPWRSYVDVRNSPRGILEVMGSDTIVVLPVSGNLIRVGMADDYERSRKI